MHSHHHGLSFLWFRLCVSYHRYIVYRGRGVVCRGGRGGGGGGGGHGGGGGGGRGRDRGRVELSLFSLSISLYQILSLSTLPFPLLLLIDFYAPTPSVVRRRLFCCLFFPSSPGFMYILLAVLCVGIFFWLILASPDSFVISV